MRFLVMALRLPPGLAGISSEVVVIIRCTVWVSMRRTELVVKNW